MLRKGLRGPVAEETSLGWALSGCVGSLLRFSEFISTHVLKLSEATFAEAEAIHFCQMRLKIFRKLKIFVTLHLSQLIH